MSSEREQKDGSARVESSKGEASEESRLTAHGGEDGRVDASSGSVEALLDAESVLRRVKQP